MKKKVLVMVLAALVLFGGTAVAQQNPIGLTLGVDFIVYNLELFEENGFGIYPFLEYRNNDLVPDLELMAGIRIPITPMVHDGPDPIINFELELDGLYRMALNPGMAMAYGLNFNLASKMLSDSDIDTEFFTTITPRARFEMDLAPIGDFYAQAELPIGFTTYDNEDGSLGLNIYAGLAMDMGLGIEAGLLGPTVNVIPNFEFTPSGIDFGIGDDNDPSMGWFGLIASYSFGSFDAELGLFFPLFEDGMDNAGIAMTPKLDMNLSDSIKLSFALPLFGIASDNANAAAASFIWSLAISF